MQDSHPTTNQSTPVNLLNPGSVQPVMANIQTTPMQLNPGVATTQTNVTSEEFLPSSKSKVESTSDTVQGSKKKGTDYCVLCNKFYTHLFRHFQNKHADESAVKSLLNLWIINIEEFNVQWQKLKSDIVSKAGLLNPTKTVCECGLVLEKRSLSDILKKTNVQLIKAVTMWDKKFKKLWILNVKISNSGTLLSSRIWPKGWRRMKFS